MLRPTNEKFQIGCFYGSISPTGRWNRRGTPRISRDLGPGSYTILKLAADLRKLKRNKKLHTVKIQD
ncbi:hypothetical protein AMELA_G00171370 [Ameiurus melas]|uniref:Uncharacterized protein n=1 Tax=Ameiurus melas TaxID=219545 RepID=A0A7J6AEK3_AMEME|nr:hypothetical protein AMELA_G00171370 [Ameiurus melas]